MTNDDVAFIDHCFELDPPAQRVEFFPVEFCLVVSDCYPDCFIMGRTDRISKDLYFLLIVAIPRHCMLRKIALLGLPRTVLLPMYLS